MKKLLLTIILGISISSLLYAQQWVHFPSAATTDWVNINDLDVPGDHITVEALVSIDDLVSGERDIVDKHSGNLDCNYLFRPDLFGINTTTGFYMATNPLTLCQDTVYHMAGTYDGTAVRFYVNGIEVGSQSCTGNLIQNNLNAAIGNRFAMLNEQFRGYIDEVRIWNVARTDSQLAANMYNLPNPTTQTGLVAYYKFEGTYNNIQGNSAWNGTPTGSLLTLATNPYFFGSVSSFCALVLNIDENSSSAINIFPNPGTGKFTIDISGLSLRQFHLTITNLLGEKIGAQDLLTDKTQINLNVPPGIYFATLSSGKDIYTSKIFIQR